MTKREMVRRIEKLETEIHNLRERTTIHFYPYKATPPAGTSWSRSEGVNYVLLSLLDFLGIEYTIQRQSRITFSKKRKVEEEPSDEPS